MSAAIPPSMDVFPCPGLEKLAELDAGALSDTEETRLLAHLESCQACQRQWESLESGSDQVTHPLSDKPFSMEEEFQFQEAQRQLLDSPITIETTIQFDPPTDPLFLAAQSQPPVATTADKDLALAANLSALSSVGQGNAKDSLAKLRDYELKERLGRGGTSNVYLARHVKLDRLVAIKVVRPEIVKDHQNSQRFLQEMQAVGTLCHPNIVHASDAGEDQGYQYLVMEYAPGLDLGTVVQKLGPLSLANACEVICQAARGLEYARQKGFVHRDVKASNLLLTGHGQVKLLDLGLVGSAKQAPKDLDPRPSAKGTADYMPPEQWDDFDSVDCRADVYALGCTLYKLLQGKPPFRKFGQTLVDKLSAHKNELPPPLTAGGKSVPAGLQALVMEMLAKDRSQRPATPAEVEQRLRPWRQGANLHALAIAAGIPDLGPLKDEAEGNGARSKLTRRGALLATLAAAVAAERSWGLWKTNPPNRSSEERSLSLDRFRALGGEAWLGHAAGGISLQNQSLRIDAPNWAWAALGQPVEPLFRITCLWTLDSSVAYPPKNAARNASAFKELAGQAETGPGGKVNGARSGLFFAAGSEGLAAYLNSLEVQILGVRRLEGEKALLEWSLLAIQPSQSKKDEWSVVETPLATAELEWPLETAAELSAVIGMAGPPSVAWRKKQVPTNAYRVVSGASISELFPPDKLVRRPGRLGVFAQAGAASFQRVLLKYLHA